MRDWMTELFRYKKVYSLTCRYSIISWQEWRDSNPRHPVLETGALAT